MKHFYIITLLLLIFFESKAQIISGQIFLNDRSSVYLNQVYITNLNTDQTIISDYMGKFKIPAKLGDKIRFTSIVSERTDVIITKKQLENTHLIIALESMSVNIDEVVLKAFKPSGIFVKDFQKLKNSNEKLLALKKAIGLPGPQDYEPELPSVLGFNGGFSLDVNAIYDLISGDYKKKKRLFEYEKMMRNIAKINKFYGDNYFKNIKIPPKLVENFLQFVYLSDNLEVMVANQNYSAVGVSIQKYLPIYMKRLQTSNLLEIIGNKP